MSQPIRQLLPGVVHWKARHPHIGVEVSSYYLVEDRVLIDPIAPPDGLEWFEGREPAVALLTNRHHTRSVGEFVDRFGVVVQASRPGMHEFEGRPFAVEPFDDQAELPGGVVAHEVGVICPDEFALELTTQRALAVADGLMHYGDELGFVPDRYIGDDPPAIHRGLREVYARLVDEVDFDNLLLAHGDPIIGGAREELRSFAHGD
jgi:hypothetical protein